jgi:polysaccharide biosynthesis protein PslH
LSVLVIDRSPPVSMTQGNDLIARHLFPRLRRDHHLALVAPVVGSADEARHSVAELFDEVVLVPRAARPSAILGALEPALARRGLRIQGRVDSAAAARMRHEIRGLLRTRTVDVVHVRQLPEAGFAADLGPSPALLELVDSEALAAARAAGGGVRRALRRFAAREVERRAIRPFRVVTVVAEADAAALRGLGSARGEVVVVPNGVDAEVFRPSPDLRVDPDAIAFSGAMSFPPNVDAVTWFARAVLPRIRAARPAATFTIVGRDPAPAVRELAALPGVIVTGTVDDVRPYLGGSAVVVAPMRSGSGIKNKVLEALAMSRPVVATSVAVEGLATVAGRDLVVADGAAGVAEAVTGLLADPGRAEELGRNGRRLVEGTYTWDACAERYRAIYAELAAGR